MCETSKLVPLPDFLKEQYVDVFKNGEFGPGREFDLDEQGRQCFRLDECIVPVVEVLWAYGVRTLGCCCGHGSGHGVISLLTTPAEGTDPLESARNYYKRLAALRPEAFL
jgi:hypothetical protein